MILRASCKSPTSRFTIVRTRWLTACRLQPCSIFGQVRRFQTPTFFSGREAENRIPLGPVPLLNIQYEASTSLLLRVREDHHCCYLPFTSPQGSSDHLMFETGRRHGPRISYNVINILADAFRCLPLRRHKDVCLPRAQMTIAPLGRWAAGPAATAARASGYIAMLVRCYPNDGHDTSLPCNATALYR